VTLFLSLLATEYREKTTRLIALRASNGKILEPLLVSLTPVSTERKKSI
jgi:hypothetical protein